MTCIRELKTFIRTLIREELDDPDLGRYAFADDRSDLISNGITEPNTEIENELHIALSEFAQSNTPLPKWACDKIIDYRRSGLYKDIFADVPTGVDTLYRAIVVSADALESLIGNHKMTSKDSGKVNGNFVWRPKPGRIATSWSTNVTKASLFWALHDGEYEVMMYAPVNSIDSDACVSFIDGLYKVNPINHLKKEQEIMTFGPIRVTKVFWQKQDSPNKLLAIES